MGLLRNRADDLGGTTYRMREKLFSIGDDFWIETEDEERAFKQPTLDLYEHEGSPYYSTARLWDDGILDPLETRRVLGLSIAMAMKQPVAPPRYGIFRM